MSRRNERVSIYLNPKNIRQLPEHDIRVILRAADDLIMLGGRTLLAKVLKGSRSKDVLGHKLNESPVYGTYRELPIDEVHSRIDWLITHGYLAIEYSGRLPLLKFTRTGWQIEIETYANELLRGFDERLASGSREWDMKYLKDRNRELIWRLLDKISETGNPAYIPLLEAWAKVDYAKVRERLKQVIRQLAAS